MAASGSFEALRDATRPYPVSLRPVAAQLRLVFDGTFADPLLGSIDILAVSDSAASGTLALDIPLRLRGVFGQMAVVPVPGARIEAISAPQIASDFAIGNPCR